jgi:hypothetical protein
MLAAAYFPQRVSLVLPSFTSLFGMARFADPLRRSEARARRVRGSSTASSHQHSTFFPAKGGPASGWKALQIS